MFKSTKTTREKRLRNQEIITGDRAQKLIVTSYMGLQPIKMPGAVETKEELICDEELPIKIPRIGYISPVKRNDFGSYPQIKNMSGLWNDANMDHTVMELHRVRELHGWYVDSRKISVAHDLWAQDYTQMVCWMAEACTKLRLFRESFQSSVAIALRYMTLRPAKIQKVQFQLLALSCIWIAYRLENEPPSAFFNVVASADSLHVQAHQFLRLFDSNYAPEDLISTEKDVAKVLQADFSLRTPYQWVNLMIAYGKHLGKNPLTMAVWTDFRSLLKCYQLLDACMASMDLAECKPSVLAAAVLSLVHPNDASLVLRLSSAKVSELKEAILYVDMLCSDYAKSWDQRGEDELELPATVDEQYYDEQMLELLTKQRDRLLKEHTKKQQPCVEKKKFIELPPIPELPSA